MKNIGIVRVNPSDYVIRLRGGKIYKQGLGMNFFTIPSEQYVILPTTVSKIQFLADQISRENQGVEVSGFAFWKIGDPSKTYLHFDFSASLAPVETINNYLKDVVESAIRHQVANMTIDEVLRKRGTIILALKKELEYISTEWGIAIETIEIKNVKIMSSQLFHNMQARFRDQIRLESETSALKTNQEIAEQNIIHNEQIALLEQEAKTKDLERRNVLDKIALEKQSEIYKLRAKEQQQQNLLAKANDLELFEIEQLNKRQKYLAELDTLENEKKLLTKRMEMEALVAKSSQDKALLEIVTLKEKLLVENTEKGEHILYKNLAQILSQLNINEINIGHTELQALLKQLKGSWNKDN